LTVAAHSPAMLDLVARDARLEHLAGGFHFTEGPVWHEDGYVLFTDVADDAIWRWDAVAGARIWRQPANMPNGMSRDPRGRLLVCEQATSHLTRYEFDGTVTVIASHFQGKELNSPNDVVCRSDGCIYFTDPPAGREPPHGRQRNSPRELDFQGIFLLRPAGEDLALQADDMFLPNGLCFSPDESLLYVNDTMRLQIVVFDVDPDGSLRNERLFCQQPGDPPDAARLMKELARTGTLSTGLPDGMRCDERGNVYCGGPGGLWVIDPAGELLGVIETPAFVGNLCWGDDDWRSLYICASTELYRLRLQVAGAPPAFPRWGSEEMPGTDAAT
jgi:sugar lactone lactonase YvrE